MVQSNMEGKAVNTLLDHQTTDPKTKDFFAHLRDGDKWAVRNDMFIKFLGRKGPLTVGKRTFHNRHGIRVARDNKRSAALSSIKHSF